MDLELDGRTAAVIGGSIVRLELDRPEAATTAAEALAAQVGGLDTVVLCAGHNVVTPFGQITVQDGRRSSRSTQRRLLGPAGAGAVGPPRCRHRHGGQRRRPHRGAAPHHMDYAAAKAGLVNLTKSLARALAPQVRVNCVAPRSP